MSLERERENAPGQIQSPLGILARISTAPYVKLKDCRVRMRADCTGLMMSSPEYLHNHNEKANSKSKFKKKKKERQRKKKNHVRDTSVVVIDVAPFRPEIQRAVV